MAEDPEFKNLSPEVVEDWKGKVYLHFYFAGHETAEDFRGLEREFQKADIYVPEGSGVDSEAKKLYNDVAQGRIPREVMENMGTRTAAEIELRFLYNTKKPILLVDIPKDDPLFERKDKNEEQFKEIIRDFLGGRFDQSIENARTHFERAAIIEREREDKMREQILKSLPVYVKEYPQLRKKLEQGERLLILFSLGSFHTGLYQKLKDEGFTVERTFDVSLHRFFEYTQILRAFYYRKNVSDELVARFILSDILANRFEGVTDDLSKIDKVLRKLTSRLTLDEMRKISERRGVLGKDIVGQLEAMGISFPHTKEQFDEATKS